MKRKLLRDYVTAYLGEVADLAYGDVSKLQPAPYAGLARGAAGTAYMLWRLGHPRAARKLLTAASADRRRGAYRYAGLEPLLADPRRPTKNPLRGSLMYGRAGLVWLDALLGGRNRSHAYADYAALATHATEDYMAGASGYLTGARILLAAAPHEGLARAADAVAHALLARLETRSATPWGGRDATGFALRWPGALHAVIAWHHARGIASPPWLLASLERLVAAWNPDDVPKGYAATWCNGTPGMALLWIAAFEHTQNELFLRAARAMASAAEASDEPRCFLCCGRAGIAYALLELHRVDPRGHWRELAVRSGEQAVAGGLEQHLEWPLGLYNGHPGIVCLASELLADEPRGFPAIAG